MGEFGGNPVPRQIPREDNTRLLTPNDWSGVSNGSTGLHRYQGEQRFAFVLLNVTDGNGDAMHVDMETFAGQTQMADVSPHGATLQVNGGPRTVAGWHGKALEFDGVDDSVQSQSAGGLNDATAALTVSLFFRPGRDYFPESGSAFYAFAQRSGAGGTLWRFGWDAAIGGLRFEIQDSGGRPAS